MNVAVSDAPMSNGLEPSMSSDIVFGRYMRPDCQEFPCQVASIDTTHVTLVTRGETEPGEHIVAYIDEIGRVEGQVTQCTETGFTIGLSLSEAGLDRMQQRLNWLKDRDENDAPGQRRHARYQPQDTASHLILPDGRTYPCAILDISISGASVSVDVIPSLGTYIMLGKMRGRVTRIHPDGIGIEFVKMLDTTGLKNSFKF